MRSTPAIRNQSGFTLVEVLAISPLLVLVVAVIIWAFVSLTGDALVARERNTMIYSVHNAMSEIENDIRFSVDIPYQTAATLPSGQGSNANYTGTSGFTSSADTLIIELNAMSSGPLDPNRQLLYYANTPDPCSGGTGYLSNEIVRYQVVYFLDGSDLTKRTLVNFDGRTVCGVSDEKSPGIFQHNSCKTTDNLTCYARDTIVASNVSDVEFRYFIDRTSPTPTTPSSGSDFASVETTITTEKQTAGSTPSYTSSLRAARIN